jgi:DNA-binding CsgD family transcriptional regulator
MKTNVVVDVDEFSSIVDFIYQGATDVKVWPIVANKICDWLGAKTCLIFTPQFNVDDGGFAVNHRFNVLPMFEAKYRPHNIWDTRAFERGLVKTGQIIRDQDLHTEDEFLNSVLYRDLLVHADIGRMIAGVVFSPEDNDGKLVVFACHRSFNDPFSEFDVHKLNLLIPHLSRALGVMFKLRDAEFKVANSMQALNCLSRGVILFNRLGHVCYINDVAQVLLNLKDGLQLKPITTLATWELKASSANAQTHVDTAISEAISPDVLSTRHFSNAISVQRPSGKTPFMLSFSSLGGSHDFSQTTNDACAIAFIYDPSKPITLNNQLLKNTYDLSKVELKVAELLVNGITLDQAAIELKVTINTIKTHLKQIHSKTNIHNRAQLVKLLMQLSTD